MVWYENITSLQTLIAENKTTKTSFVFAGDFHAHHVEWLDSVSFTDCHGIAARDFATSIGCQQLVDGPC